MSKITSTIWPIEPHTEAKHVILRKYLDAWLPIITTKFSKVLYIDGFAGPGEYIGGKDGSPIIAINCVIKHKTKNKFEIVMAFIEKDLERFNFLQEKLSKIELPGNITYQCFYGDFQTKMKEILDYVEKENSSLAPAFIFIDPFGWGIPLSIIKNIMKNRSCEVFITFMYEEINRFITDIKLRKQFNDLFGVEGEELRKIDGETNPQERMRFLHDLYKKQLTEKAEIKYVKSFMMKDAGNKTQYFLFFGTNRVLGLEKMKDAMWKMDETGNYKFSDATYNPSQDTLFETKPDLVQFERELYNISKGKEYSANNLRNYTIEKTPYLRKHCNQILRKWETMNPPKIERQCPNCSRNKICKKHKNGFNVDCRIKTI